MKQSDLKMQIQWQFTLKQTNKRTNKNTVEQRNAKCVARIKKLKHCWYKIQLYQLHLPNEITRKIICNMTAKNSESCQIKCTKVYNSHMPNAPNQMQCNLIQCESRFGLMWCANDIISFAYKFCFRSTKYTKPLRVRVSVCVRISMLHQQFDPSHPLLHSFTLYITPRKCFKLQIKFRHCNQLAIATNLPCSGDRICTFFQLR